jgi:Zn-dependent protease with chaperone function
VGFSPQEIERGRRYHRARYRSGLVEWALAVVVLCVLAFTDVGDALLPDWSWWAQALVYPAIVLAVLTVVRLPIAYWRDYLRERSWGLSTQTAKGWFGDVLKGFAVETVLWTIVFFALVGLSRATGAWPLIAAPLAALFVVLLTFVAPVLLEPIFNKFKPLEDEELVADLRALSVRAGVPIRDVLVADASRRTNKANAYVSGFGATRRVVVFDTLLGRAKPPELRAVLAHELGHRRYGDVAAFSAFFVAAAVAIVVLLWAILGATVDPRDFPLVLLVLTLVQPPVFAALAAVARRWEYRADRFALTLTRDLGALESMFADLVESNVADLDPPRVVYYLRYTHPTVPERLDALRRAAHDEGIEEEAA